MLGPALAQLFHELNGRKSRLTSYEKRLYVELVLMKALNEPFPELTPGRLSELPELSNFSSGFGFDTLSQIAGTVIGPQDGDDEAPRLQINCIRDNCPNKEFE